MEEKIIPPVDATLIETELTAERFLRTTNKAGNEIYVVDAHNAPNTMQEIGRLREIAFRTAGGGTGKSCDIDEFDTMENPCQQLVVWNPESKEIIGGYRFILGENIRYNANQQPIIATSHLFHFSKKFLNEYMPHVLELGRSFVRVDYQIKRVGAKGIFALDNLWDGLGALTVKYPQVKYLFGKVTMYPTFGTQGRDLILYFLQKYFPDKENLVKPITPLRISKNGKETCKAFFSTLLVNEGHRTLVQKLHEMSRNIPPLVNAYINLSSTMRSFGTAINDTFGDVEETGILITVADIYAEKRERHIESFIKSYTLRQTQIR